jgi:hypothetical protein
MKQFFKDETGQFSMKRLCGFLCVITLCITMYHNSFSDIQVAPSESLVYAVASFGAACLGLTSAEKIFKKNNDESK